jgi:superfamily II DNA/RNA helicase
MGYVKFDQIKYLILDEADRMLDIGFYDDILKIITFLPKNRQTLMFSATMPDKIRQLAKKILSNPTHLSTEISKPADGVLQAAYLAHNAQKIPLIKSLIDNKPNLKSILIFSSTKLKVNEIVRGLRTKEFLTEGISSNLEQDAREAVLLRFRSKKTKTLVATDVLSRGIDIKAIDLVINFDVPNDAEDYVHRVGRTARADETGVALTLVNEEDMYKFKRIEVFLGEEIMKIPMPARLGEAPIWNPNAPRPEGRFGNKGKTGRKNFRGRNKKK